MFMFSFLEVVAKDSIFQLNQEFKDDLNLGKINLGVGIYLDDEKDTYVHPVVQNVAAGLSFDNFNYNTIQGHRGFLDESLRFLFPERYHKNLAVQAVSGGTHGCALISRFLLMNNVEKLIIPTPTWGNHYKIFEDHEIISFPHLKGEEVNFDGYKNAIVEADENTALLLHGGKAHNPTGLNLSLDQLSEISDLANKHEVFVILDFAYLGLSEGMTEDLKYLHKIHEETKNIASIISFSKNATLYEHRVGLLFVQTDKKEVVESHLQKMVRQTISQPAGFGQKIMYEILKNYKDEWLKELGQMHDSIEIRRREFVGMFTNLPSCISETKGMFALLPLSAEKIKELKEVHSVYIPSNGRINFGGLSRKDISYLAEIIKF